MPSSDAKLPPLDLNDEVKNFEAYQEKRDIVFKKCSHHDCKIVDGWLRCKCGAGWKADTATLQRLQKALLGQ